MPPDKGGGSGLHGLSRPEKLLSPCSLFSLRRALARKLLLKGRKFAPAHAQANKEKTLDYRSHPPEEKYESAAEPSCHALRWNPRRW